MDELISVIVPIYLVENYLDNCIRSILNQTYKNLEIILVDDGSPDNCGIMCDNYAKYDSRIKVIHKNNGGLSDARNMGISISTGRYITCIDSDDYISHDCITYLYNLIKKYDSDISICNFIKTSLNNDCHNNSSDKNIILTGEEAIIEMLYAEKITTSAWGKLYKRTLFYGVQYPIGKYSEDMFTTYKLFMKSKKVVYGNRICYYYLRRDNSILTSKFSSKHFDVFEGLHMIKKEVGIKNEIMENAYRNQFVSSVGELLEKCPPKYDLKKSGIWDEMKNYRLSVCFDKRSIKRVRIMALITYLGPYIFSIVICRYYRFKWRKTRSKNK